MAIKIIKGFPNYWVSSSGEVTRYPDRSLVAPHTNHKGYLKVNLRHDDGRTNKFVHRLVAEHFVDNPDGLPFVNHLDGDKQNNDMSNLEWCTASHNMQHAYDNGFKSSKGGKNGNSKLDEDDVKSIRSLRRTGVPATELADMYKVNVTTIRRAISGERYWKNV